LRAYAIQAAIVKAMGKIGYDHTAMTKVQASGVLPESNAMTESPAITSQKSREASANTCETINQIRIGLREGTLDSK
jgi:hypothetical protein